MKSKEYEMPEDYQRALRQLTEIIAMRDEKIGLIKELRGSQRREALAALDEVNRAIEDLEQKLAEEYEQHQTLKRAEEKQRAELFAELEIKSERLFIIVKHTTPHKLAEFTKIVLQDLTPEEVKEFYERIALREAAELDRILKGIV